MGIWNPATCNLQTAITNNEQRTTFKRSHVPRSTVHGPYVAMWQQEPETVKAKRGAGRQKKSDGTAEPAQAPERKCWICLQKPVAKIRYRECTDCLKDWDALHSDARRKKEIEHLKEFKKTATDDQLRRMLFTWKKSRKPGDGKPKNLFPWAAVFRRWTVKKNLQLGKGGVMKSYHSFIKWYTEQKGWKPERAHQHWDKRLMDRHWRKGVDPEDRPHCHICV